MLYIILVITLVILLALLTVLVVYYGFGSIEERFNSIDHNVYSTNILNYSDSLNGYQLLPLPQSAAPIAEIAQLKPYESIIIDPQDYMATFSKKGLTLNSNITLPPGYFVAITSGSANSPSCALDIANKSIGVLDRSEEVLLDSIIAGYRIDPLTVLKSYVPNAVWSQLDSVLDRTYDMIYAYMIPGSHMNGMLSSQPNIKFLGFNNIDLPRITYWYPYVKAIQSNMKNLFKNTTITVTDSSASSASSTLFLSITQVAAVAPAALTEAFTIRSESSDNDPETPHPFATGFLPLPNDMIDSSYICVGDTTSISKQACESSYDIYGKLKPAPTVWDAPCVSNSNCAFFDGTRGGCTSGQCEFPIGVHKLSFTKYVLTDIPFCSNKAENASSNGSCPSGFAWGT